MGGSPLLHDAQFVWAVHDVLGLPTAQYLVVVETPLSHSHVPAVAHFRLVSSPQLAPAATQVPVGVAQWALLTHVPHDVPVAPVQTRQPSVAALPGQSVHAYVFVPEALQYCLLSVPQLASTAKQALERRQGWVVAHAVHSKSFEFSSYPHAAQLATVVLHDVQ